MHEVTILEEKKAIYLDESKVRQGGGVQRTWDKVPNKATFVLYAFPTIILEEEKVLLTPFLRGSSWFLLPSVHPI
jgi:hypothetical protein